MGGFKSVIKGIGNLLTFGAVSAHDQAKAQRRQAQAQEEAARIEAQAAKEAAANTPQDEQDAMSAAVRDEEAKKIRRRRGMTGTILTSPLGTQGAETGSNKLGVL